MDWKDKRIAELEALLKAALAEIADLRAQLAKNSSNSSKTPEQQKVIKYFFDTGGCMGSLGTIKDDEYESMVMTKAKSVDFKQKALAKIGLDESQVNEVNPVHFEGYYFDKKGATGIGELVGKLVGTSGSVETQSRRGRDRKWRSSAYQVTWLFFGSDQIFTYQCTFHMDNDEWVESTKEYFYDDVTCLSTALQSTEREVMSGCLGTHVTRSCVDTNSFNIVVPGDEFSCAMPQSDYAEQAIQGMKAKLREKKTR